MRGGSEFGKSDFLLFAKEIKKFTYKTYLVEKYLVDGPDESDAGREYTEDVKKQLTDYKRHIKHELLDSYARKSKFDDLNKMIVRASKDELYESQGDELYDFVGLTVDILRKIGIRYVLTEGQLHSIRRELESSSSSSNPSSSSSSNPSSNPSSSPSSSPSISSRTSSRGSTKNKKKKKKPTKKKKKPTKKKKRPTKKMYTTRR